MISRRICLAPLALGATVLFVACDTATDATSSPRQSTTSTSTPAPSPNGTIHPSANDPPPSASASSAPTVSWAEQAFEQPIGSVVADRDRFVAVSSGAEERSAWTSNDGSSWERHSVPAPSEADCDPAEPICLPFVRSAHLGPMVRLDDTLYSLGATEFFNDVVRAVGWRWTDGQDWQVIESESPIFKGGAFRAVATSDEAIFAVTHAGYPLTERHWLWKPDTSWQRVGDEISVDNPIGFRSVAWRDGQFIAVGEIWDVPSDFMAGDSNPAVWSSNDGTTWISRAAPDRAMTLCSVTATTDAFFAVGLDTDGQPIAWRTEDGEEWGAGALPTGVSVAPGTEVTPSGCSGRVVELSSGYLAFVNADDVTLTWTSGDGASWEEGDVLDARTGSESIAAIDDTIVAFGQRGPRDGHQLQVLFVGTARSLGE